MLYPFYLIFSQLLQLLCIRAYVRDQILEYIINKKRRKLCVAAGVESVTRRAKVRGD